MAVKFEPEHLGYHHGQHDWVLRAVDDGMVMGSLWFTEYENTISVKMVESNPEYKKKQKGLGSGIGRVLVRKLQEMHPETQINPGMTTEEGDRLLKALPRRYEPSSDRGQLEARLTRVKDEIARLEPMFDGTLSQDDLLKTNDRLNRLYDLERKIERAVGEKPKGKWIVTNRQVHSMKFTDDFSLVRVESEGV